MDQSLLSLGFNRNLQDQVVYMRKFGDKNLLVGVYYDLIMNVTIGEDIIEFKSQVRETFEMSDLELLTTYLGIQVLQGKVETKLH